MLDFLVATGHDFVRLRARGASYQVQRALEGSRAHRLWTDETAIWVATLGEGVWCSRDGGTLWSNFAPPLPASNVWSFALGAPRGEMHRALYAGGDDGALLVSHDGGKRWDWLDNLWLLPSSSDWHKPRVQAVAPHPLHPDWLLVSLRGVGVIFSSDGGFSWDDKRANAGSEVRELLWHPTRPECALALEQNGIASSADGGWTWQRAAFDFGGEICAATFDAQRENWLLLAHGETDNRLWSGEGEAWQQINLPSLETKARCVAAKDKMWALGLENGAVWTSENNGKSWLRAICEGRAPLEIYDFKIVPNLLESAAIGPESAEKA